MPLRVTKPCVVGITRNGAPVSTDERDRLSRKFCVPHDRLVLSLTDLCTLLGITPNTARDWDRQGLPCLQRGQKSPRQNWVYDTVGVITWMCERARQEGHEQAMKKVGGGPAASPALVDGMTMREDEDVVDFRTRLAKMHQEEIKTSLAAKSVVRVSQVVDTFTAHLADASLALQSIKGRVMAYMEKIGVPLVETERVVGNVIDDACAKFASADPFRSPLDTDSMYGDDDEESVAPDPEPVEAESADPEADGDADE
jgi:phage terminase Nu1 subunit (DNA packaging protein)